MEIGIPWGVGFCLSLSFPLRLYRPDGVQERACQWCKEVGAVQLCEVMENWQDLAEHLRLKPAERRRLAEVGGLYKSAEESK